MKSTHRVLARIGTVVVALGAGLSATLGGNAAGPVTTINGFVNYQLGDLASEYCPDANSPCQNGAAEPAIRADKFGNFYGSSENGLSSGTEAWKSIDGGLHYVHLPSPNKISSPLPSETLPNLSPAGGDTDLATASAKNQFGLYNVYVSSLEAANTAVSSSLDGGHSWSVNNAAAKLPAEDREWIAADGANKVCISYVTAAGLVVSQAGLHVECSYDAGMTFTQVADAIGTTQLDARSGFKIGNLAIDQNSNLGDPARKNDLVYATFTSGTLADAINPNPTDLHVVWVAVSTDGGNTFQDYQVYNNPDATVGYAHNFTNISVDQAGNVYSFFSDNHFIYFKYSTDHGQTWLPGGPTGAPIQISRAPSNTSIFPWSAAGAAGKVDVVWYGTSFYDGVTVPDNYPYPTAAWSVYFSQNLNVLGSPGSFSQQQVSPVVHFGGVCEGGVTCLGSQAANRDLFDDFGVAVRPATGLASIIYSDDQFDQYNHTLTYTTSCTQPNNNTGSCNHTSIATQTSGSGIGSGGGGGGANCHEADGNGNVRGKNGGDASFQSDEDSCEDGDHASEQMQDPGSHEDFSSSQVQSVQFDDSTGTVAIAGLGTSNGLPVTFLIVEQAATSTAPAYYTVELSDGYVNSSSLTSGAVTLQ